MDPGFFASESPVHTALNYLLSIINAISGDRDVYFRIELKEVVTMLILKTFQTVEQDYIQDCS
jgi:hypothetical protein